MKKVMILAGGNDQIALMEEIRRYFKGDVEILLVDMSDKVRAIPFADRFLKISTMDKAAVLAAAREEKIDYILTACGDQPLSTMAYVATEMGLPTYLTEQDVRDLTNKSFMKDKIMDSLKFLNMKMKMEKFQISFYLEKFHAKTLKLLIMT